MKRAHRARKKQLSDRSFEAKTRAFHALARMRHDKLSLEAAAREESTTPATIRKYLPAALRRARNGKWIATKSDRYIRYIVLPDVHGPVAVRARGSSEAQLASAYLASLSRWARPHHRRPYELAPFAGKKVGGFQLITSPRTLQSLLDAGLLQLDSMYAALKDVL